MSFPFEELIHQLDMRRAPEDQCRLLRHWLGTSPDDDLSLALTVLLQRPIGPRLTIPALKKALFERINKDLFDASKEAGSDLSETLALLWPGGTAPFEIRNLSNALQMDASAGRLDAATSLLDGASALARDLIIRIAAGRFKSPLPPALIRAVLAETFDKPLGDVEQYLANSSRSLEPFTNWLQGAPFPEALGIENGFVSIPAFHERDFSALTSDDPCIAVPRGNCLELVTREDGWRFYTLGGDIEDKGESDLGLPPGLSLLVFRAADTTRPLLILDLLVKDGQDQSGCRDAERSAILEDLIQDLSRQDFAHARPRLASKNSPFEDPAIDRLLIPGATWSEIARPPFELHLIILYVEGPVSRKGHFSGDVTLGATTTSPGGSNMRELVPVGKAAASSLSPNDKAALESFIAANTLERFGPVRKLTATLETSLIVRATCRAVDPAKRRKAGLVLTGATLSKLVDNSLAVSVSTLDDLTVLALL